ncbi:MAG: hypothetical protein M3Q55_04735 [Acidobacteriota bacterium]|nr:hypothetical protein [Acidobacteriota bacterium]
MSARDFGIDQAARAMTTGAPSEMFAERVMAPIRGVPQPGFTSRVMARLATPPPRARRPIAARALRTALAVGSALAMMAALWRPGDGAIPVASAPVLVSARIGEPAFATPGTLPPRPIGTPRVGRRAASTARITQTTQSQAAIGLPEPERPLYRIAQLEPPAGLAIRAIASAPPGVAPLGLPTALIVPGLRFEKEKP